VSVSNSRLCGDGEPNEIPAIGHPLHIGEIGRRDRAAIGERQLASFCMRPGVRKSDVNPQRSRTASLELLVKRRQGAGRSMQ